MFDAPVDGLYTWIGVSVVAAGALAVAAAAPSAPPPDAAAVSETVDGLAASSYAGSATVPLAHTTELRLTSWGISLRGAGGSVSATFQHGPVAVVTGADDALAAVLDGADPRRAFDRPGALKSAADATIDRRSSWRPAPDRLHVRRVTWGGVDVTLVG